MPVFSHSLGGKRSFTEPSLNGEVGRSGRSWGGDLSAALHAMLWCTAAPLGLTRPPTVSRSHSGQTAPPSKKPPLCPTPAGLRLARDDTSDYGARREAISTDQGVRLAPQLVGDPAAILGQLDH